MLIICLAVVISSSYAWLVISRAPSISGVSTHIGSNGALEIALLSDKTYIDTSLIRSSVGDSSAVQEVTVSNLTWGNVVDLSHESYGLNDIFMYPSRLNLSAGGENQGIVNTHILTVPRYGLDGRINSFDPGTLSAVFKDDDFTYSSEFQSYGVRGIGTMTDMTLQQSALASARSRVKSYTAAAQSATESAWKANGLGLTKIFVDAFANNKTEFSKSDVAIVRDTATRMKNAVGYLDSALRQGVIGIGSSVVDDEDLFNSFCDAIENPMVPLSQALKSLPVTFPQGFTTWVQTVENDKKSLQEIISFCDSVKTDTVSWSALSTRLSKLVDYNKLYINDTKITDFKDTDNLLVFNQLTLSPASGVMSDVAEFTGNYKVLFAYADDINVEVITASTTNPPLLELVSTLLEDCKAVGGDTKTTAELKDLYGFAIDMAFRCNTDTSLQLQTDMSSRVESSDQNQQVQGEGSYMEFNSDRLEKDQILALMDAMRIGFIDSQNNLLAVAKLNTSNYSETDNGYRASVYLYDYSVSSNGSMSMGARREKDAAITSIDKGTPSIITAIVWLDGDHVDNSLVASTIDSMTGSINLQFASDVELNSANIPIG